jgi:hypothetical protein
VRNHEQKTTRDKQRSIGVGSVTYRNQKQQEINKEASYSAFINGIFCCPGGRILSFL